jgi:3-hydroxymyristoyl/3-hydroxydecanoyl-(acyl carrier protein) dehydratase
MVQRDRPDEPELRGQRKTEDGIELDLFIPTTLSHLEGHFPDLPIVPGVAQIDWAAKYTTRYLELGNGVAASLQVKFRRLMSPETLVTLVLSHQAERGRISFTYRRQDEILASGSFALGLP